jgi:hypothetical protein
MTMPTATRKQQLRRDFVEQRLVAFADQLAIFVGTIRAKGESSLDGTALTTELGRIRDSAVDLLAHLTGQETSKQRTPAQPTAATVARRSRGPVDAPGKRHRKPQPQERIDKQMGEPRVKQMGLRHGAFSLTPISNFVRKTRDSCGGPPSNRALTPTRRFPFGGPISIPS